MLFAIRAQWRAHSRSSSSLPRPQPLISEPPSPLEAAILVAASKYPAKSKRAVCCISSILANGWAFSKEQFWRMIVSAASCLYIIMLHNRLWRGDWLCSRSHIGSPCLLGNRLCRLEFPFLRI